MKNLQHSWQSIETANESFLCRFLGNGFSESTHERLFFKMSPPIVIDIVEEKNEDIDSRR